VLHVLGQGCESVVELIGMGENCVIIVGIENVEEAPHSLDGFRMCSSSSGSTF
jgi:hypothetical protein